MENFRVTLLLNHFFSDQRASCRIYITSHMKTIQDLQNHINEIFSLDKNFYLISNNLYLPDAEDIRVLKEDDVVVAVPAQSEATISNPNKAQINKTIKRKRCNGIDDAELEINHSNTKKENKCKKSKTENNEHIKPQQAEESVIVYDSNKTKKKKKDKERSKKNSSNGESVNEALEIETNGGDISSVVKIPKPKKNKDKLDKIDKEVCAKDLQKTNECNKSDRISQEVSFSSRTYPSVSSNLLSKPKSIQLMEISRSPKIIKTIHVYDGKSSAVNPIIQNPNENNSIISSTPVKVTSLVHNFNYERNGYFGQPLSSQQVVSSNDEKQNKLVIEGNNCKEKEDFFKTAAFESNDNVLNSHEINSINIINESNKELLPTSKETIAEENAAQKNENVLVLNDICVHPPVSECIPNKDSATNSILSNEDCSESVVSFLTEDDNLGFIKPKRKRKRTRKNKVKPFESTIPDISIPIIGPQPQITVSSSNHIRFLDDEGEILENKRIQQKQDDADNMKNGRHTEEIKNNCQDEVEELSEEILSPLRYETLLKEEIMKFPIMNDIFPKIGDVIAFKIFKLSEHYTPELSDFIIAKVEFYDMENKEASINILVGGEQCVEPEGKFSIKSEENPAKQSNACYSWDDLKEPRLLFP